MKLFARVAIVSIGLSVLSLPALAGKEEITKYLEEAAGQIERQAWDDAKLNIELAQTEAADLPDADKPAVLEQIKATQAKLVAAQGATMKPRLVRTIERAIDDAKPQIGNEMFDGMIRPAEEALGDSGNVAILGDDAAKYQKQIATFRKLHRSKFAESKIASAQESLAEFKKNFDEKIAEIQNPDTSPNSKESAIEELERELARWNERMDPLPASDARVVEIRKTLAGAQEQFTKLALADRVNEVLESLKRGWELYKDDWDGHESETGVTWADYKGTTGDRKIDNYGAPKSRELVERHESFMRNRVEDEKYQSVKDAPAVKAYMDELQKTADAARARLIAAAKGVVDASENEAIASENKDTFDRLEDSLRVLLVTSEGAQDGSAAALRARIVKKLQAFLDATEGAEKARAAWYDAMTASAKKNWDEIAKSLEATAGFDPTDAGASKGKLIRIETDNLMGWRFKPGDFPFATTVDGHPVAGVYADDVKSAIAQVQEKLGRDLGDDDRDGRWTVIAEVTGRTGRMMQKKQAEGDVVDRGTGNVVGKYTLDYADPVTAPIIRIVAVKIGPLAVSSEKGMAKEDGSIGSP